MKKLIACAVAMTVSAPCFAQDHGVIWGSGATSCGNFLAEFDGHNYSAVSLDVSWVLGYLTAMNAERTVNKRLPLKYADPNTITAYLVKHCRDNPLHVVFDGTLALTIDLSQ